MSIISEVKQRVDIAEVVNRYTTLTKAGRALRGLCPFHSEKHPSFFVYPEQQTWHCFGACNTGGDVFSFVMKKENADFAEALRLLAERAGVTIPSKLGQDSGRDEKERLYQANEAAAQYFHNLLLNSQAGEQTRQYLASRGLLPKTIADFQLGFSLNSWEALKQYLLGRGYTESEMLEAGLLVEGEEGRRYDRFRHRLMFPVKDIRGGTIGFGARVLDDSLPKYINSPQTPIFDKGSRLYGINLAAPAIRQQNLAVIVEGYIDVITAHQNGFSNVVAAMGIAITENQVNTLKRLTRNIVLALDADAAGEEASRRCVTYENSLEAEVRVILLPGGKDPDDVIKEDAATWRRLMEEALPVVDYTLNTVSAKLDLTTAKGKSQAVERLLPILAAIKDPVRQAHYLQKLARLLRISERSLEAALSRISPAPGRTQTMRQAEIAQVLPPLISHPLEEYCLALLLKHPELKERSQGLSPEYFENSENREIFLAWQQASDLQQLKDKLASAIWEHLDALLSREVATEQVEQRYTDCVLNLRQKFLQNLEARKAEMLALEAEAGGTVAELAKLREQGIEASVGLRQVFTQKARRDRR